MAIQFSYDINNAKNKYFILMYKLEPSEEHINEHTARQ